MPKAPAQPNFIIIGAAKCGTTALHAYLRQHPQIFLCEPKEPRYFSRQPEDGDATWRGDRFLGINDWQSYLALFSGVTNEPAVGEASARYLWACGTPERVMAALGPVRLIVMTRDPAARAWSAYHQTIKIYGQPPYTFEEELTRYERTGYDRVDGIDRPNNWFQAGFYDLHLSRWLGVFDPSRLRVYRAEDLSQQPQLVLRDMFEFLSVNTDFTPDPGQRFNEGGIPARENPIYRLLFHPTQLKSALSSRLPLPVRDWLRHGVRQKLLRPMPPLPTNLRRRLVDLYRPDIERLQHRTGWDLRHWMEIRPDD